ncbi:hypothetical protein HMPREF2976_01955 [Corynebacterium sp. HMSC077D10]|uniref:DUF3180 domain-containing protein n=1 Tax=unclassified Corynebacterium TaxID=2624378 RepID=UPI000794D169|nr:MULTISPECIES: DUF3180 domain-containing protein [unclassified Corynebacterium]KXB52312.1 hypothetical protein HMPREF0307_02377 [Corynebacterium sp. DNF00584]OFL80056.1 hypothetical protein HMPREF2748_07805 [Corynebacterium sp. HMSC077B05]OFN44363.1 hypothetical protein HMPREF2559_08870 [Corynebacterium sp. HMSC072G08]OFP19652.1 hypothetical protein HMPREF2998_09010 [Corynebacterium sp. HMSC065A05]OFP68276.1 hypothetical protein HMPREF2976_01955 [Corynebacterium sp. HMSC077D10]
MQRTSLPALIGTAVFVAAAVAIVIPRLYGYMGTIPLTVSITLWLMAIVCAVLAWRVREAKKDDTHGIGLDTSQLNPMTITNFMLLGKASAWTGAIVGAAYAGVAVYVIPHAHELVAAAEDVPGVLASLLGGAAMAVAGVVLERYCEVPPPADGAAA